MINKLIFLFLLFSIVEASANIKEKIIQNLETTNNLTFNFEQNVNGKTENGQVKQKMVIVLFHTLKKYFANII